VQLQVQPAGLACVQEAVRMHLAPCLLIGIASYRRAPGPAMDATDIDAPVPLVNVLHQDDSFFFVAKPPGLVCTGAADDGESFHALVKQYARYRYGYQPGLLHRLDKGTSGIMTYAKSEAAAKHYLKLQAERGAILKEYVAVVHGRPPKIAGRIEGGIAKSGDFRTYVVRSRKSGKPVLTTYKMLRHATAPALGEVSSLSLRLFSGRKHQIRASCRKIGCSIVGDVAYGGAPHHVCMLHAHRVAFRGANGSSYDVCAPPPPSWAGMMDLGLLEPLEEAREVGRDPL